MRKDFKIEISWRLLERISKFYQFPSAVFLGNEKMFKNLSRTREDYYRKKLEKIKRMLDD